jgi:hypothetical protein
MPRFEISPGRLQPVRISPAERDPRALDEELIDGGKPNTGAAAGNHGNLVGQSQIHSPSPLILVIPRLPA